MAELAEALLELKGLAIPHSKVERLRSLYERLHDYDKRPLSIKPRSYNHIKGKFARSKHAQASPTT